tara:strand:+ start:2854 stop:3996 length:1143 start_codon:yes stop_codon:yes gene_type:complete
MNNYYRLVLSFRRTIICTASIFILFLILVLKSQTSLAAPEAFKHCGGRNQAPCAVLDVDSLCYNVYRGGTHVADYYGCYIEQNGCDGDLIAQDGVCKSLQQDSGINCCTDIKENGKTVGYEAKIDLTKAKPVVPDINLDWCDWNILGRVNAVRRMSDWMNNPTYTSHLAINTNFFNAQQTQPNPHLYMCTNAYGPVIRNDQYIAGKDEDEINGITAWSLVFYTPEYVRLNGHPGDIFKSSELPSDRYHGIIANTVTGVLLAKKGSGYNTELDRSTFKPKSTVPRTAVGISSDKKTLYIAVFQNGEKNEGKTLEDLANYMLQNTPSELVINFDGGGSSTLYYKDGSGEDAFLTPPSDLLPGLSTVTGDKYYRPFPVFLGFR